MKIYHYNFDRIVGPTHNFSGLSAGNTASTANKHAVSNPKKAALEGLEKMQLLSQYGLPQAVLPPNERPHIPTLRSLGYLGTDKEILSQCAKQTPELLPHVSSAADMFAANIATIAPSQDTIDGKLHITPANLATKFHRAIENPFNYELFRTIFSNLNYFVVHPPLLKVRQFCDEGSANHIRFCKPGGGVGLHMFVYGFHAFKEQAFVPGKFPARQSCEAGQAISRKHRLLDSQVIFAQQLPRAIDAGVFHNDVISVGNDLFFFYHEEAFLSADLLLESLRAKANDVLGTPLIETKVTAQELSLEEAVSTYLFNSQIVTLPDGNMLLAAPSQCRENAKTKAILDDIQKVSSNPINNVVYVDLNESMRNGGGPACLRLKITLTEAEQAAMHQGIIFNNIRYIQLKEWIGKHYRDRLSPADLADPKLLTEVQIALDELTKILKLGHIYSFQKSKVE